MEMEPLLKMYAVQNLEGKYFRSKGYQGYGKNWVDELDKAKIYAKLGQARARVTWFSTNHSEYGIPNIVILSVTMITILNEEERVNKSINKKQNVEENRKKRRAKRDLENAEFILNEAQKNLDKLRNGK